MNPPPEEFRIALLFHEFRQRLPFIEVFDIGKAIDVILCECSQRRRVRLMDVDTEGSRHRNRLNHL